MSVIRLSTFGGEMPRASARALPADKARISYNMYHGGDEFRPIRDDVVVASATAGAKTLYRFDRLPNGDIDTDMTQRWIVHDGIVHYAKGQLNDDKTSRSYYSFDGGTNAPRVKDSKGVDKLLGIPAPAAPQVSVIVGDEYTPEEYTALLKIKSAEISGVIRAKSGVGYFSDEIITSSTVGYTSKVLSGSALIPSSNVSTTPVTTPVNGGGTVAIGGTDGAYVDPSTLPIIVLPAGTTTAPFMNHTIVIYFPDGTTDMAVPGQRYNLNGTVGPLTPA